MTRSAGSARYGYQSAAATAEVVSGGASRATTSASMPASRRRTAAVSPTTPAPTTTALTPPAPRAPRAGARAAGRERASSRGRGAWADRGRRARRAARPGRARDGGRRGAGEVQAREHVGAGDVERAGGGGWAGSNPSAASSSTAAARSATAIGQRSSSVKKAMSRTPSATSRAIRSCGAGLRAAVDERGAHDQRVGRAHALGLELRHAVRRDRVRLVVLGQRPRAACPGRRRRWRCGPGARPAATAAAATARVPSTLTLGVVQPIGGVHDDVRPRGADGGEHRRGVADVEPRAEPAIPATSHPPPAPGAPARCRGGPPGR